MMKGLKIAVTTFALALFAGGALAVPPGKTVEFTKSPMGKVTFDGAVHAGKGLGCANCHTAVFKMKQGTAEIKMADHQDGKTYCFTCHNGEKSFASADNCARCHKP